MQGPVDDRWGEPTRLVVQATPESLLLHGAGSGPGLTRALRLAAGIPTGALHISVQAAACDTGAENPACHLSQRDWGIPIGEEGAQELTLDLRAAWEQSGC